MKRNLLLLALSVSLMACNSGDKNQADSGEQTADSTSVTESAFGAKVDESGAVSMDSLLAMVNAGNTDITSIKVVGKVTEACQAKGCWMNIDRGDGTVMRVTFKDYGFFVPKDCGGKTAVMMGRAYMDTTSVEDLRHFAEDAGKSKEEIQAITAPEVELAFEAEGVIIRQ